MEREGQDAGWGAGAVRTELVRLSAGPALRDPPSTTSRRDHTMVLLQHSRKPATVLAILGLSVATAAALGTTAVNAVPSAAPPPRPSQAQSKTFAAQSASSVVAARPAVLHAGKGDSFVAKPVISDSSGLQYVPYERTFKGLPVIGGDFVV